MARFKRIDGNMPKSLWHLAVQEAAYTRNRCFNKHTGTTPYTAMTGEKCDLSKILGQSVTPINKTEVNLIQGVRKDSLSDMTSTAPLF